MAADLGEWILGQGGLQRERERDPTASQQSMSTTVAPMQALQV